MTKGRGEEGNRCTELGRWIVIKGRQARQSPGLLADKQFVTKCHFFLPALPSFFSPESPPVLPRKVVKKEQCDSREGRVMD